VRVAALYDLHGNVPALDAVLEEVQAEGVGAIVSGGDVVWGPQPAETLHRIEEAATHFVRGNADRHVAGDDGSAPTRWCADRLTQDERDRLGTWPGSVELDIDGIGRVLFCHASPNDDEAGFTEATPEKVAVPLLAGVEADLVVCGHTHAQFDLGFGGVRVVNAGSVGMPAEGRRGAFWALLGREVELRCTEYDVHAALPLLLDSGFPVAQRLFGASLVDPLPKSARIEWYESQRA
jgi:predicted phosphodiesterase